MLDIVRLKQIKKRVDMERLELFYSLNNITKGLDGKALL